MASTVDAEAEPRIGRRVGGLLSFPESRLPPQPGRAVLQPERGHGHFTVAGGTSFSLNNTTYYASPRIPIAGQRWSGTARANPAFTMTTGWGNMIPHRGGHWSFPFEIGAAFIGAPSLNMALTSGQACDRKGRTA